jgi:Tfp pilus assembly protein PilN
MKAVNLIPSDRRRGGSGSQRAIPNGPGYAVIGLLAVALLFVTIYVLTSNTISERKTKVAKLQAQVAQEKAAAAQLASYASFEKLAQQRAETVREIASARFDWHSALADLSKVVPADTSLQSLVASVAPGAAVTGGSGGPGTAASLRGDISTPAFVIQGCTHTQDEVAKLLSRLRVMNGVTRVTLGDSEKQAAASAGATVTSSSSGSGGCGANTPAFDLVVFFKPLANAGPDGVISATPVSTAGSTPAGSTPSTSTTPASTPATATTPTTPATTTTPTTTTTPAGGSQ